MAREGIGFVCIAVALSGGTSLLGAETDSAPEYDSKFVGMRVPERVSAWEVFPVEITLRNTGTQAWEGAGLSLRSMSADGTSAWGTDIILLAQGVSVAPGKECTFRSNLRAPGDAGRRSFQWRLARERAAGLGEATPVTMIEVVPRTTPLPSKSEPAVSAGGGKRVLGPKDFEYLGSFKAPKSVGEARGAFSECGVALRPMPDGRDRLFLNYTHPVQTLFEVEIPPLTKLPSDPGSDLPTAELKRVWGPISASRSGEEDLRPNGGIHWDEARRTMWWTWYHGYKTGDAPPVLAATRLADDGGMTSVGPWYVKAPGDLYKSYWGGVIALPRSFADEWTGGKTLALGFGGYYSICAAASRGPALGCIPEPDPGQGSVAVTPLLCHPQDRPAARDGDYFSANCGFWNDPPTGPEAGTWSFDDWCRAGVFVDTLRGHAYVAFVRLGTGRLGYDFGAITSAGSAEYWYIYDPRELGRAARGDQESWTTAPSVLMPISYPAGRTVTGACFDARTGRLYICVSWAYCEGLEGYPMIHVYGV